MGDTGAIGGADIGNPADRSSAIDECIPDHVGDCTLGPFEDGPKVSAFLRLSFSAGPLPIRPPPGEPFSLEPRQILNTSNHRGSFRVRGATSRVARLIAYYLTGEASLVRSSGPLALTKVKPSGAEECQAVGRSDSSEPCTETVDFIIIWSPLNDSADRSGRLVAAWSQAKLFRKLITGPTWEYRARNLEESRRASRPARSGAQRQGRATLRSRLP